MSRQEKWNLKHRNKCRKSQRKYMNKLHWEAKMYRRMIKKLKKEGKIVYD